MMQATKSSLVYNRIRKKCDLLVKLKKNKIATNDVEYGVRREWLMMNPKQQMVIKMKIMRKKIGVAFTELMQKKVEKIKIWKESKRMITGTI